VVGGGSDRRDHLSTFGGGAIAAVEIWRGVWTISVANLGFPMFLEDLKLIYHSKTYQFTLK
jgi:hypothetical protein